MSLEKSSLMMRLGGEQAWKFLHNGIVGVVVADDTISKMIWKHWLLG
jgi:hypothetical protein